MRRSEFGLTAALVSLALLPASAAGQPEAAAPEEAAPSGPDCNRLARDRAYALEVLARTDARLAEAAGDARLEAALLAIRAAALETLNREAESAAAVREMLTREPDFAYPYLFGWAAVARFRDPAPMVDLIALAARRVPESSRPLLHRLFDVDAIISLHRRLRDSGDDANRERLEEALVAIGWPGENDPTAGDIFRMLVLDRDLEAGDRNAAARIAVTVTGPESLTMLVLARRYEGLTASWHRPIAAIEEALARFDATTERALSAEPRNFRYVLQRVRLLRWRGRESEALAVLAPFVSTAEASYSEQPQGPLILGEATQALLALGRADEAVALSARLVAFDRAGQNLTREALRHSWLLWQAGRPAASAAEAERLLRESEPQLSPFGRSQLWATLVCALNAIGRSTDGDLYIQRLRDDGESGALTRALLCANRLDEVETLTVARLESANPISALLALQDYRPGGVATGPSAIIYERLAAVRSRPRVATAIGRAGRLVALPFARIFPDAL